MEKSFSIGTIPASILSMRMWRQGEDGGLEVASTIFSQKFLHFTGKVTRKIFYIYYVAEI